MEFFFSANILIFLLTIKNWPVYQNELSCLQRIILFTMALGSDSFDTFAVGKPSERAERRIGSITTLLALILPVWSNSQVACPQLGSCSQLGAALAHRGGSPTHSLSGQRKRAWQGLRQVSDDVILSLSHHLLIIHNTVSHLHLSQRRVCRRKFTLTTCFHSRVSQNWVAHSAFCSERAHVTKELTTTQRRILLIWICHNAALLRFTSHLYNMGY